MPNPHRAVAQVASVQTLVRRIDKMKAVGVKFDLIVIDEAHLSCAKSYLDVLAAWPEARAGAAPDLRHDCDAAWLAEVARRRD